MGKSIIYYSTNTRIAHTISEKYYNGIHYVWCCPFFFKENHPVSSTPKKIYHGLIDDVKSKDRHSTKIRANISGILAGAAIKLKQGIITQEDYDDIEYMLTKDWQFEDFTPLVFVIPSTDSIEYSKKKVAIYDKASAVSDEFKIENLNSADFDVISFHD
jgi:hypothetical protein